MKLASIKSRADSRYINQGDERRAKRTSQLAREGQHGASGACHVAVALVQAGRAIGDSNRAWCVACFESCLVSRRSVFGAGEPHPVGEHAARFANARRRAPSDGSGKPRHSSEPQRRVSNRTQSAANPVMLGIPLDELLDKRPRALMCRLGRTVWALVLPATARASRLLAHAQAASRVEYELGFNQVEPPLVARFLSSFWEPRIPRAKPPPCRTRLFRTKSEGRSPRRALKPFPAARCSEKILRRDAPSVFPLAVSHYSRY